MNWTKYKIALLIFIVVVAAGTSTAVSRFNHSVRPREPARVLDLANCGPGAYRVTLLGEDMYVHLPVYKGLAWSGYRHRDSGREYLTGKYVIIRDYGASLLESHKTEIEALERNVFEVKRLLEEWLFPPQTG